MRQFSKARRKRSSRLLTISALSAFLVITTLAVRTADSAGPQLARNITSRALMTNTAVALLAEYHGSAAGNKAAEHAHGSEQPGIHEDVPAQYLARYQQWKREFLATETGRQQWSSYQTNPNFSLTVVVARDNAEGGTTGDYRWNGEGKLIAATIT